MATPQSNGGNDRARKRFLPSIKNPMFNPSEEDEITVTPVRICRLQGIFNLTTVDLCLLKKSVGESM
jgi:hypothetical protein